MALSADTRLRRILAAGYFPEELPPPFVSTDFSTHRKFLLQKLPTTLREKFTSEYEGFSFPRYGRARRRLAVINPINMLVIGKEISDNWGEIRKHLKKSVISEFKPIFDLKGRRALFGVDFDKVEEKINDILARYRNCVKTDISRFYGTIYTHSIPWALYGKSYCKKNHSQPKFKQLLGDRLDKFVRNSQSRQSIGIPVGPDFSRIIAEIVAVELDAGLNKLLNASSRRAVRYVDDIAVGYTQEENDDVIVSQIAKVLGEFELEVNLDKTHVLGVGRPFTPEWKHTIRRFRLSSEVRRQRTDLEAYFKEALYLSELSPKDNVLDYALKRSTSLQIDPYNWGY